MSDEVKEITDVVDPDYETYRARLDQLNLENSSKPENEDYEDHKDGPIVAPDKKKKPSKSAASNCPESELPAFELSDFQDFKYKMNREIMGNFLIFNLATFQKGHPFHKHPRGRGAAVDARKMEESMKKLGFKVYRYDDPTTKEVNAKLKKYVEAPINKDANAFGCAFFSHGMENGELATFDGFLNVKDLIEATHNENLVGKPRLFFFQACRGADYDKGHKVMYQVARGDQKTLSWPREADILCHFATTEDHFAFKKTAKGSWFVEDLTEVLNNYALELEFHHVLLRVNRKIAFREAQAKDPQGMCS